jgi:hypothetical protein
MHTSLWHLLPSFHRAWRSRTLAMFQTLAWLVCASLGLIGTAHADFRDPADKSFTLWPNIPVVRASDFAELAHDRKAFADLHDGKNDPATIIAALQAVDSLQQHHERSALQELGRSLNTLFISEIDRLTRGTTHRTPKLRFDFANITPDELQRPATQDAKALNTLKAKASQVTLVGYITYSRMEGSTLQATLTLIKLADGAAQSFTVAAPASQAGAALAQDVFHYFYGTRFAPFRSPMPDREWVLPAPSHTDQQVSLEAARRYCRTQGADLPTEGELEMGEAAGLYHGGIEIKDNRVFHTHGGMLYAAQPAFSEQRLQPNRNPQASNAFYYCIRKKPGARR